MRYAWQLSQSHGLYYLPQRLIFTLSLGEAPDAVPSALDVKDGMESPAERVGHGPVDRVLRDFGGNARIVRVHTAAASFGSPGQRHEHFDALEHVTGVARQFKVELSDQVNVDEIVDALRQTSVIEHASPQYLSVLPFGIAPAAAPQVKRMDGDSVSSDVDPWASRYQVNAANAMAYEPGDRAVLLAVVDTGVQQEHGELQGMLRPGFDTVQLKAASLAPGAVLLGDVNDDDTDPNDEVGHGTACAGITSARGLHIPPGLAGECSLLPIRVLGAAQFPGRAGPVGIGAISDIDVGVKMAIDLGAKVLNMSFGTPVSALNPNDSLPHEAVVRYGAARGCVMVAASGNSGQEEKYVPAAFEEVIAVGAVDSEGRPTSFSTRGEHVDLAAPGERIATCGLSGLQLVTGTSFAAPFVAAAAALLVSRAARRSVPLDGRAVRRLLVETVQPWPQGVEGGNGAGVLDVYAALRRLDADIGRVRPHHRPVYI